MLEKPCRLVVVEIVEIVVAQERVELFIVEGVAQFLFKVSLSDCLTSRSAPSSPVSASHKSPKSEGLARLSGNQRSYVAFAAAATYLISGVRHRFDKKLDS